jgi:tetratricopeptide (TPR) repeat protein
MYCVECGTKNPDDARFCKQCGRKMEPAGDAPAEPQSEAAPRSAAAEHILDPEARYKELLAQGFRHYDRGEFDGARDACRDAVDLRPDGTDAHALLSTCYERLGDIEKAIAERERVLELNPASIADREKLEALRTGITQVAPRRILSPRLKANGFWDSPAGAALAAVAAALVVIAVGYGVVTYREQRTRHSAPGSGTPPGGAVGSTSAGNPAPAMPPGFSGATPAAQPQTPLATSAAQQPPASGARTGFPQGDLGPLPLRPQQPRLEAQASPAEPDTGSGGFFDPGAGSASPPANPRVANSAGPGSGSATGSSPGPGRIEIVVAPQGPGPGNPSPNAPGGATSSQMESRNNAEIARNLQLAGDYRRAAQAWERALAGAGDDSARIHQAAALCYQRVGDNPNARRHYGEAIQDYRDLMSAGKAKEAAEQGIRTCEAGLKVCQ